MAEFKVIETQEELDKILKERLDREKAKRAEAEENYKKEIESLGNNYKKEIETLTGTLEAKENELKEQSEKLQSHDSEVAKLTEKIRGYELDSIKHRVANEYGLPYDLAERLAGDNEDAIKADAEALKKYVSKPQTLPLATSEVVDDGQKSSYDKALADFSKKIGKE